MVDANNLVVGTLIDWWNGLVVRQVGQDKVLLQVLGTGVPQSDVTFYHTTTDCTGTRYLTNNNGAGLVFMSYVQGGQVAYTSLVDPSWTVSLVAKSYETMTAGQDLNMPGVCTSTPGNTSGQSMGAAVVVSDSDLAVLVAPLHLQ